MTSGLRIAPGLVLPLEAVTETFAILANRGKGKSNCAAVMVEELYEAGLPVVVLDVKGDWWGLRSSADGKGPGLPFIIFGGDHADVPLEPTAGALLADLIVDERIHAVLDMSHMSKTRARQFACDFAERLYHRNRDPLHLVIDEADVLIPQRATAETARLLGAMEDIAKRGRGKGIGLTVISQRGQEVAKSVLELMETVILLGMTGRLTIAAVKDWIGVHVDETTTTAEVIASLPTLKIGEAWVWSPSFLAVLQRVQIRLCTTFDSHATPKPGQVRPQPKGRADIDLAALGERISATVEKAKADDPKVLRARIAELERQLAAKPAAAPPPAPIKVPVMSDDTLAALRDIGGMVTTASKVISDAFAQLGAAAQQVRPPLPPQTARKALPARPGETAVATVTRPPVTTAGHERARPAPQIPPDGETPPLKLGARRILETMGRHNPTLLTVRQIATMAKFKITGGTWSTYWSAIRRAGYVEQIDNTFRLSEAGREYVGVVHGAPMTTEDMLRQWRGALKAGARTMLDALVAVYPGGLTRDELAAEAGMVASGGTFGTYLGTLRRNGLVDVDGGMIRAADTLFLGQ